MNFKKLLDGFIIWVLYTPDARGRPGKVTFFSRGGGLFWVALVGFFGLFAVVVYVAYHCVITAISTGTRLSYTHTPLPLSYTSHVRSLALLTKQAK